MRIIPALYRKFISFKNWYWKASWKKKLVVTIIALIVLFFLTSPLRKKPSQYITEPVTLGTIIDIVSESGNIVSKNSVNVFSTSTGVFTELYVENGDIIKAGQNLFKVKSTATPEEKAKAYSDYLTAQNSLNTEKSQINSLKSALFKANKAFVNDRGINNPSDDQKADAVYIQEESNWLQAESDYNNQAGVIKQAEAAFTKASLAYQATQNAIIIAPIAGYVGNFSAKVGEKVIATSSTSTFSPVLIIGDPSDLSITININEVDRPKMKIGQKAEVKFIAIKDKTFKGEVLSVDTYGTNTNGVVTYSVEIETHNLPDSIAPGMTVNVEIETNKHENVLTVPNSAIKAYQGGKAVQILDNDKMPKFIPVKIGLKGPTRTEIIEGIAEKTQVITSSPKPASSAGPFGG